MQASGGQGKKREILVWIPRAFQATQSLVVKACGAVYEGRLPKACHGRGENTITGLFSQILSGSM